MGLRSKTVAFSLASVIVLATTGPVFSDAMLVPRLGFPTTGPKRIYLDITRPQDLEAIEKARKEQEKAEKKERKAQKKALKATKSQAEETVAEADESTAQPDPDTATEEELSSTKENKKLNREEARKQADAQRRARLKARLEEKKAEFENAPVDGIFYLFDLKQNQIRFKESSKPEPVAAESGQSAQGTYYVEFKEDLVEGVYDLAVRGSGHRSEKPVWVSDYVYWDALQPVLYDVGLAHCPMQEGVYQILQQCYRINARPYNYKVGTTVETPLQMIRGGWYIDNTPDTGLVKSTLHISRIAQMLMNLYNQNPDGYKYVVFRGSSYAQSPYPDILDEARWGLDYLVSIQQQDGTFPQGIEKTVDAGREKYWLMPDTPQSTAHAVMTLATAVQAFRKEDLSLAIKFLRAAERGWTALQTRYKNVDPELLLIASGALHQISADTKYTQAYEAAKAQVQSVSAEMALLAGPATLQDIPVRETEVELSTTSSSAVLPLIVRLHQGDPQAADMLRQWVTDLFGYERITLRRDANLTLVSAWVDPLQWMASKTGEIASRLSQHIPQTSLTGADKKLDDELLKRLEELQKEGRLRIKAGYRDLKLTTLDRVYLGYILGLLNQQLSPSLDPDDESNNPPRDRYYEPPGTKRGFWPKLI